MAALILASCSISGGDDDDDSPPPTATATDEPANTATLAPELTETETAAPTATGTATPEPTSSPTATASPTATSTPTSTSTPTATPIPIVQNPFENVPPPDIVLENYKVIYAGEVITPEGGTETLDIAIEQSSPTRYHLKAGEEVEIWVIEDATYFRNPDDGSIFQIPSAVDPGLVSPAAYLIQVPDPANVPEALSTGEEEVDGRPAAHYSVSADQIGAFGLAEGETINDPEGTIEIWIDNELGFISQMDIDVEWTDENGTRQSADIDLLVFDVGTTGEIAPPI